MTCMAKTNLNGKLLLTKIFESYQGDLDAGISVSSTVPVFQGLSWRMSLAHNTTDKY